MPLYKILATDNSYVSAVFEADEPNSILHMVRQLQCDEADVLENDTYSFSVEMENDGMWTIFQRDHEVGWERVGGFGWAGDNRDPRQACQVTRRTCPWWLA